MNDERTFRVVDIHDDEYKVTARNRGFREFDIGGDLGHERVEGHSVFDAVTRFASQHVHVVEVRGPGESTTTERVAAVEAERDAALALVADLTEGRKVPPTDAELDAHEAAGGSWVVTPDGWAPHYVAYGRTLRRFAEQAREPCMPAVTWRALDATGRPCAWPVVDGGESREGEER